MNSTARQLALLREIDAFLRTARIRYWLRGGWALDFLLGEVTGVHGDIDLVTWKWNETRIARVLQSRGFGMTPQSASVNFEKDDVEVNVLFLEKGQGVVYTAGFRDEPRWNEDVLRGPLRELGGLRCRTISPQGLLEEKEKTPGWLGRPARQKDIDAMATLRKLVAAERPHARTRPLGDFGERVAAAHLEAKGYRILATRFRVREGEVDIIAQRDGVVAFVEVKTRRGDAMGTASEGVSAHKEARLLIAAQAFEQLHPELPPERRIDVIAIDLDGRGRVLSVQHIENAVEDGG